jgi:hypothetical protein
MVCPLSNYTYLLYPRNYSDTCIYLTLYILASMCITQCVTTLLRFGDVVEHLPHLPYKVADDAEITERLLMRKQYALVRSCRRRRRAVGLLILTKVCIVVLCAIFCWTVLEPRRHTGTYGL